MLIRKSSRGTATVITKDIGTTPPFERFIDICKVDDDKRMVYGVATKPTLDTQNEIVEWPATLEAIEEFKKWANLREMHKEDSAAGTIPIIEVDHVKKQVNIGAYVVDDKAWEKVKKGVYKGFSIGGKALSRVKEFDVGLGKLVSKVKKYVMNEISLVDRPAHPECLITLVKRASDTNDPLRQETAIMEKKLGTFKSRLLTDADIEKLPDSKFGLVKMAGKRGGTIIKRRYYCMPDKIHAQAVLNILPNSDLSKKDQFIVHKKACDILGKSHNGSGCTYCHELHGFQQIHKSIGEEMSREELRKRQIAQAQRLLAEAGAEDYEAMEPNPNTHVEGEELKDAPQEADFDPKMKSFEGEDGEGEYEGDEEGYEDEEGVPYDELDEDAEGWEGDEGYEDYGDNVDPDTARTHVFTAGEDRRGNYMSPDSEDNEGEYDEDYDEEAEGDCPYCPTTIRLATKAAQNGNLAKAAVQCVGCGEIYDMRKSVHTSVAARSHGMVNKAAANEFVSELAKRDEIISEQNGMIEALVERLDRMEKAIQKPNMRKMRMERENAEETLIEKSQEIIKSNLQKAQNLRNLQKGGKVLTAEEEAFCKQALDDSLEAKVTK